MKKYTLEEKKEYFQKLRNQWQEIKNKTTENELEAVKLECQRYGLQCSAYGYIFCKKSMESQNLDGVPYIDAKTFQGWKQTGFIVKKGETAKIQGISFIPCSKTETKDDKEKEISFRMPKTYNLFHKSQVEAIA